MSDWTIELPWVEAEHALPADQAVALACKLLNLPVIGGPSGTGFSFYSEALRCPTRFKATRATAPSGASRSDEALDIGIYFHVFLGLQYASAINKCRYYNRGLVRADVWRPNDDKSEPCSVPKDASERLQKNLIWLAQAPESALKKYGIDLPRRPSLNCILEAKRLVEAHELQYDSDEDITPLAVEWWAKHPDIDYTCRYDLIARVNENDLLARQYGLKPGDVIAPEHKTAGWLSERVTEGWFLDGEILGQIMCWGPSGCEARFGPLAAVVVNIVTKERTPKTLRVVVPPHFPTVANHYRWMEMMQGQMAIWRATGVYPQNVTACWDFGRKCAQWDHCLQGDKWP